MGGQFMPKKGMTRAQLLAELADTESDLYQAVAAIGGSGGEEPGAEPLIEAIASSPVYDGEWTMPDGIQAGELLLALVIWGDQTAAPIDGFTILETGGGEWDWQILQYKIATGDEPVTITPDPSWAQEEGVIVRISGVDQADPIILAGLPERIEGSSATSKTLELDSISPDAAGSLAIIATGNAGGSERSLTVEGEPIAAYAYDGVFAHGGTIETLSEAGATGTRTVVLSTGATEASNSLLAAMVVLNPA